MQEHLYNLAVTFYTVVLDILRFCDSQDRNHVGVTAGESELLVKNQQQTVTESPADEADQQVKATYLNLAFVQLKLLQWRSAIESCESVGFFCDIFLFSDG